MKTVRNSGVALGTVLLCLVTLSLLLFVAVSGSISHLRIVNSAESQEHARNLAESAISKAISEITESRAQPADVQVLINGVDGTGLVTFDSGRAPNGYSTYNLEGTGAIDGARSKVVPPNTVHLIGIGEVGDHKSYVECVFFRPPFPDGLVATGPVRASVLKLFGVRSDDVYSGGDPENIPAEDNLPGNLYSNFASGWAAGEPTVRITDSSDISGSVGAVGSVSLDATSTAGGELLPGSSPRPMVNVDINEKINALRPNAIPIGSGGDVTLDQDWFSISSGNLSVGGDLDLNGSALLVEGNLEVSGAVLGTGVVLVDGNVAIRDGGSSLTAGEQTAIACTGDFSLNSTAPEGNFFKGLVYCEGDFSAEDITVVGATVVNSTDNPAARGQAELTNVRFVHNPGSVTVSVSAAVGATDFESDFTYAFTVLARRNATDDGFLFTITCYVSDDHENSKNLPDDPRQWPTVGRTIETLPDLDISDADVGDPQPLKDAIAAWIRAYGEPKGRTWPGEYDLDALYARVDEVYPGLTSGTATTVVTLNLNNLLGEWMSSSRVLMWRPLRD